MMKINHDRMYVLRRAMNKVFRDTYIEIRNSGREWGVNWGALGTVDAEATRDFAEMLFTAADLVDHLNEWDIKDGWDDEPAIEGLDRKDALKVLAVGYEMAFKAIERQDWKNLKAVLTMDAEVWK